MYKSLFTHFLKANEGKYHFACHSHHYWPDCSREAQLAYWDDTAKYVDNKWGYFFEKKISRLDQLISDVLNIKNKNFTYAPNTHELVYRFLSSLIRRDSKLKIISTDSEFYSFERQINRLIEEGLCEVDIVPTYPYSTFKERFSKKSHEKNYQLAFYSNVFFNSGYAIDALAEFSLNIKADYQLIDGYHSFMAVPLDLSFMGDHTYFVAGGYKYASAGEGSCFLISPQCSTLRPINTGWFADLAHLDTVDNSKIQYSNDGLRFAGATQDYTAIYRFIATLEMYKDKKISVETIHQYVIKNEDYFITGIAGTKFASSAIKQNLNFRGHFLAFDFNDSTRCLKVVELLKKENIICDSRNSVLRLGFCIYQDQNDIDYLISVIKKIDKEI
ncbi:aminotransferase class V-fold PLP-dependent enzyme [Bacteriovorax sp. Seq25_V]|uniref:aminotransferase class V-fold PLP-dependent enzyme n=1 Tax=Bacteriovorax sp. Seq25_V TaxID=1201288 RepID=UPI00038A1631|nr:aminotransferase class V-fold PLP-dependent enzyme [Bacteriovorax sp. Seq25_V]EQC43513.1 aminotransferase, class V [Bacteriovorax sp. Seq25_V]